MYRLLHTHDTHTHTHDPTTTQTHSARTHALTGHSWL